MVEVIGFESHAPVLLSEQLLMDGDIAGQDGQAGGHGFEQDIGEAFFGAGGNHAGGVLEEPVFLGAGALADGEDDIVEFGVGDLCL